MKIKVFLYYMFIYMCLYIFSLCFSYIEGDDAATVMYHLMGRKAEMQPPYSSYHSMFDIILSVLDAKNEPFIRGFSICISFIFGLLSLCLLAHIIFLKNGNNHKHSFYGLLLLPFIIPEVLFSSLLVNPTMISISGLLLSHIFLLKFLKNGKWTHLTFSVLLFGLGASFRWSCGFYLFILFGEYILYQANGFKEVLSKIFSKKMVFVFLMYTLSVVFFIYLSGYSPTDIYMTYSEGNSIMQRKETSLLSLGAVAITFLTPALIFLLIAGVYYDFKHATYKNGILFLIGLFPYLIIGLYPSYKYMITLIVPLILLSVSGMKLMNHKGGKVLVICTIFLPWIIGVNVTSSSAWGPGFELKNKVGNELSIDAGFNPDNFVKLNTVELVFKSGMAMPTLEGPRPLFGFSYCLFEEWKDFVYDLDLNRNESVNYAIDNNLSILQDVQHSYMTNKLIELGYMTKHKANRRIRSSKVRDFVKDTDTVTVSVLKSKNELFDIENIKSLKLKQSEVVIYTQYTNIISKLKTKYKENFSQKSAHWGILKIP